MQSLVLLIFARLSATTGSIQDQTLEPVWLVCIGVQRWTFRRLNSPIASSADRYLRRWLLHRQPQFHSLPLDTKQKRDWFDAHGEKDESLAATGTPTETLYCSLPNIYAEFSRAS